MTRANSICLSVLLFAIVFAAGCSPWYTQYGIDHRAQLRTAEAIPAFKQALRSASCSDMYEVVREARGLCLDLSALTDDLAAAAASRRCHYHARWDAAAALGSIGESALPAIEQVMSSGDEHSCALGMAAVSELPVLVPEALPMIRWALRECIKDPDAFDYAIKTIIRHGLAASPLESDLLPVLALGFDYWAALDALVAIGYPSKETVDAAKILMDQQTKDYYRDFVAERYNKLQMMYLAYKKNDAELEPESETVYATMPVSLDADPVEKQITAVFKVHDASGKSDDKVLVQLTAFLITTLTATGRFKVIPQEQLKARLMEQKSKTYSECVDESCQIALGKSLAASKSLAVQLLKVGKDCAVTANLYDLKTETTEKGAMVKTKCGQDELLDAMSQVAEQLSAK